MVVCIVQHICFLAFSSICQTSMLSSPHKHVVKCTFTMQVSPQQVCHAGVAALSFDASGEALAAVCPSIPAVLIWQLVAPWTHRLFGTLTAGLPARHQPLVMQPMACCVLSTEPPKPGRSVAPSPPLALSSAASADTPLSPFADGVAGADALGKQEIGLDRSLPPSQVQADVTALSQPAQLQHVPDQPHSVVQGTQQQQQQQLAKVVVSDSARASAEFREDLRHHSSRTSLLSQALSQQQQLSLRGSVTALSRQASPAPLQHAPASQPGSVSQLSQPDVLSPVSQLASPISLSSQPSSALLQSDGQAGPAVTPSQHQQSQPQVVQDLHPQQPSHAQQQLSQPPPMISRAFGVRWGGQGEVEVMHNGRVVKRLHVAM